MIIPEAVGEPTHETGLIVDDSFQVDPNWTYNTSEGRWFSFQWDFGFGDIDNYDNVDITIELINTENEARVQIDHWNKSGDVGVPRSRVLMLGDHIPLALDPADYIAVVNVTASGPYPSNPFIYDVEKAGFSIWDGTDMVSDLQADPVTALNDGTEWINISWNINRITGAFDDTAELFFNLWIEEEGGWAWPEMKRMDLATEYDNLTVYDMEDHIMVQYDHTAPLNASSGDYGLYVNATDDFGYNEIENETVFSVQWWEVPPVISDETVMFSEDTSAEVDLNDHFTDYNEDPLDFWFNSSELENIMIHWIDDSTINISAPQHWNGVETVHFHVNDSTHNVTLPLEINVTPVEDPFQATSIDDRTIMIDEVEMVAEFDPMDFFFDPDGPVDFYVSLDKEWNYTSKHYTPLWEWSDGNFSVTIDNETKTGEATILGDLEEGSATFNITGWLNGTNYVDSEAMVMVEEVNDPPQLAVEQVSGYANENTSVDLDEIITDVDGPVSELNFTEVMSGDHIEIDYDNETNMVVIVPEINWTGETSMTVNVTDSVNYAVIDIPVMISWKTFMVSGQITFQDEQQHIPEVDEESKVVTITFTMNGDAYTVDTNGTTGNFSIELRSGVYDMGFEMNLDDQYLYEAGVGSGYMTPTHDPLNLDEDKNLEITILWEEFVAADEASWEDINFDEYKIVDDDGEYNITVPIKDESVDKTGFDELSIKLVIVEDEDDNETYPFDMIYNPDEDNFYVHLTEDDLSDLGDGKKNFYFTDGENKSDEESYEFKETEEAGILTIIILVVLIVLVLVALVFIMRKPAEEEFEEEEEEELEEERICPGCGEVITEEVDECPYCGESLEE